MGARSMVTPSEVARVRSAACLSRDGALTATTVSGRHAHGNGHRDPGTVVPESCPRNHSKLLICNIFTLIALCCAIIVVARNRHQSRS